MTLVVGLTGSIGMGKSTVARMFADEGVPVFDSDAAVHRLQGPGGALVAEIERLFPGSTGPAGVDRGILSQRVLAEPAALRRLEALIHPAVARERTAFASAHASASLVVLDIPLLFETGADATVDKIVVVSASADIQRARVLARPGMNSEKFDRILRLQWPDAQKRARADFVVETDVPLDTTRDTVRRIIACLTDAGDFEKLPMREIVLDTETTGLSPAGGDRVVEIGCVELVNRVETGRTFHVYLNPGRAMPSAAEAVHGLSDTFLADKPQFAALCEDLLGFIGEAPIVAHNAAFDFGFINHELSRCGRPAICTSRMVCTLQLAQQRLPGAKHSLDALCTRFGVDRSIRIKHGALIDAQLLAQVYVELTGGRQIGLGLVADPKDEKIDMILVDEAATGLVARTPRPHEPTPEENERHAAFLKEMSDPLWNRLAGWS